MKGWNEEIQQRNNLDNTHIGKDNNINLIQPNQQSHDIQMQ